GVLRPPNTKFGQNGVRTRKQERTGEPMTRMSEAEVSLRLALWLIKSELAEGTVEVAIDGAQIQIGETVQFKLGEFLASCEWRKERPGGSMARDLLLLLGRCRAPTHPLEPWDG